MNRIAFLSPPVLVALALAVFAPAKPPEASFELTLRSRAAAPGLPAAAPVQKKETWPAAKTAIIVCDMWDHHWCKSAEARVGELAGPMNEMLKAARAKGAFIIHAPSTCTDFYKDTPQRKLAKAAKFTKTPLPLADTERWGTMWNWPDSKREGVLPIDDSDMGCDCKGKKCEIRSPWTRQTAAIDIAEGDAITDDGQETWNLLSERKIEHVVLCGVHLNMCVLGRPFAIRQLVRMGQNVALMRDMTDTMYNPERPPGGTHFTGTERVIEHVERYWCPSFLSSDITGKPAFKFTAAPLATSPSVPVFNGKDLAGWHGWAIHDKGGSPDDLAKLSDDERKAKIDAWTADAKKHWSVENGELVNDGHGAYLATEKEYGDIELTLEYKTVAKADSGIYLRNAPQVQIWDVNQVFDPKNPTRRPHLGSGGLFNNTPDTPGRDPLVVADKPFGEWNSFRIVQVGEGTSVWLNGKLVVDHARMENYFNRKAPLPAKGKILLQTHGGEIRWRNIAVREIPADEANAILRKADAKGFEPVFNGKDFAGWDGAIDQYEIADGAIVCKKGKGGNIYTKAEYADFTVRLEYKLPPGGNNGLAIRTPGGKAHVATQAMCEIQILDDTDKKYAKLDPRQFNGSIYGMVAPHRGYLRPVGEWNFMEVTAKGHNLRIELNGTRIVDADVSLVKEFKDNTPHPGKDRLSGHFGFAGHNDPVAFRNIAIRAVK
ncbi:MAG: family 16 glycoside hydrolase [Gemmataceae bacterium]